jgi:pentatricopeptide repeat protein
MEATMKTLMMGLTAALVVMAVAAPDAIQRGERFDTVVREDFFAGFAGDGARLDRGMATCERILAAEPDHAEALVWHGSGLGFKAGLAFRARDGATGATLWARGLDEMNRAVALAPNNVGVLIPRGAMLLAASRSMPPALATPLITTGVADYERTLAIQGDYFSTLGDHAKGELLFGLADGYGRLGRPDKARAYFERLISDAAGSGHVRGARDFMASGVLAPVTGLGCVGCHR